MSDLPDTTQGGAEPASSNQVVLQPGQRLLASGAIYDDNVKRIVGNTGTGKTAITHANASEYHAMRQARILAAQAAARKGMAAAVKSPSALVAVAKIAENMTGYATTDRSIGAVKAAEFVVKLGGMMADRVNDGNTAPAGGASILLSPEAVESVVRIMAEMRLETGNDGD